MNSLKGRTMPNREGISLQVLLPNDTSAAIYNSLHIPGTCKNDSACYTNVPGYLLENAI